VAERNTVYQIVKQRVLLQKKMNHIHEHQNTCTGRVPNLQLARHCCGKALPWLSLDLREQVDKRPESGHVIPQEIVGIVARKLVF
jgi:hypothetical protein